MKRKNILSFTICVSICFLCCIHTLATTSKEFYSTPEGIINYIRIRLDDLFDSYGNLIKNLLLISLVALIILIIVSIVNKVVKNNIFLNKRNPPVAYCPYCGNSTNTENKCNVCNAKIKNELNAFRFKRSCSCGNRIHRTDFYCRYCGKKNYDNSNLFLFFIIVLAIAIVLAIGYYLGTLFI